MCGIAGILNLNGQPPDRDLLVRLRDTLEHRGPDDAGIFIRGGVGLASRRLSVVDLSPAGHQPMSNEDGTVWLVFNGEIYNYVELAQELQQRGHEFRSRTDSETIIHLWEEEGERCVQRLNGMFAFVIWDDRTKTLFASRDRMGIKPFHYYMGRDAFVFASEMKAILEHPSVSRTPSYRGLADYLFAGSTLGSKTVFADIAELPPGHNLTLRAGKLEVKPYWSIHFNYQSRTAAQVENDIADLIDDAVRVHCRSDASLGCHLSGGLDSGTVVALAVRHRSPMPTFSIRFDGGPYFDETRYARIVAEHVGAQITCATPAAADLSKLFAALIWHMDMPMPNTGGFAYFTVSELAAKYVKVTLTGHGGDEVFAGYPAQFLTAFGSLEMFDFVSLSDASVPGMAWPNEKTDYGRLSRKVRSFLLNRRLHITPAERQWLRLHCDAMPGFNPALHQDFVSRLGGYSPVPEYLQFFRNAETDVLLDRCLHHDLRCYLPGLLHMEDRVSMALSLESRVPLLDYRLVEYMATIPVEQKVRGREPKYLLRRIASRILPPDIAQRRDKSPFPVPAQAWFTGELGDMVRSILHAPVSLDRGIFNPDYLRAGRLTPNALWTALNVEMWFRIFVDRDPVWIAASQTLNGNGDLSVDEVLVGGTAKRHKPTPVGLVSLDPDQPLDPPDFP